MTRSELIKTHGSQEVKDKYILELEDKVNRLRGVSQDAYFWLDQLADDYGAELDDECVVIANNIKKELAPHK